MAEQGTITKQLDGDTGSEASGHATRGSERRSARRLRLAERRTGFDRRKRYPVTGTLRESPVVLLVVLVAINALSALDFALTSMQLQNGTAREANPVLASLFDQGAGQAWLFKTTVVLIVSIAIWQQRRYRAILAVAVGALILYVLLIAYHVAGIAFLSAT